MASVKNLSLPGAISGGLKFNSTATPPTVSASIDVYQTQIIKTLVASAFDTGAGASFSKFWGSLEL